MIRRKANCSFSVAKPAVDKRIEHQPQELVHQRECALLGIGRRLAVELRERGLQLRRRVIEQVLEVVGSVPPPLMKLLIALPTLVWFVGKPGGKESGQPFKHVRLTSSIATCHIPAEFANTIASGPVLRATFSLNCVKVGERETLVVTVAVLPPTLTLKDEGGQDVGKHPSAYPKLNMIQAAVGYIHGLGVCNSPTTKA